MIGVMFVLLGVRWIYLQDVRFNGMIIGSGLAATMLGIGLASCGCWIIVKTYTRQ